MKQVAGLTSTYSSDEFGVCSTLFELGGLVVMHDASGCNSTYTTHDEPRWFDMDSMVYVSAISEMEAIMGDDEKLIRDLVETARELHPKFLAVIGAPIPYMIGTDLEAIARIAGQETGLPAFGFPVNGMGLYTQGISMAMKTLAEYFCTLPVERSSQPSINIIGATPLDFSLNGSMEAIWSWAEKYGFQKGVCMAMGSSLEEISHAGEAHINLVVSYGGLEAARVLRERYGTPYLTGVPFGEVFAERMGKMLREIAMGTAGQKEGRAVWKEIPQIERPLADSRGELLIVGESVQCLSLAAAVELEQGIRTRVLCTVDTENELLREGDLRTPEEDDLLEQFRQAKMVAADPLFRPLCTKSTVFYELPHTAFSGRIYEKENKNRIDRPLGGPGGVL